MLLNMDGFDDNTTPDFYNANPWGETFTDASPAGAFSPSASAGGSVTANPTLHSTDQMSSFCDPAGRSLMSTRPVVAPEDTLCQMYCFFKVLNTSSESILISPLSDCHLQSDMVRVRYLSTSWSHHQFLVLPAS